MTTDAELEVALSDVVAMPLDEFYASCEAIGLSIAGDNEFCRQWAERKVAS